MTQEFRTFQYLNDKTAPGLTSFAGLPLYIDMATSTGLLGAIDKNLQTKTQGWTDSQIILSLLLLNMAGGDSVADIERLEADEGLRTLLLKTETQGMKRKERRKYERRFRKSKQRAFPSESVVHRYLEQFHHAKEESKRQEGTAFIPAANDHLDKLT